MFGLTCYMLLYHTFVSGWTQETKMASKQKCLKSTRFMYMLAILVAFVVNRCDSISCELIDMCSCTYDDGTVLDITSLGNSDNTPRWDNVHMYHLFDSKRTIHQGEIMFTCIICLTLRESPSKLVHTVIPNIIGSFREIVL